MFDANFENTPYNAQNNAEANPKIIPCVDQLNPFEVSSNPLTNKQPIKVITKQINFLPVIFSLNKIADKTSANIGAKLNNNEASDKDNVNAASL